MAEEDINYKDERGYPRKAKHSNLLHRKIAYKHIYLPNRDKYPLPFSSYIVHHIDGDKENYDVNNLAIMTQAEHEEVHESNRQIGRMAKEYLDRNYPGHDVEDDIIDIYYSPNEKRGGAIFIEDSPTIKTGSTRKPFPIKAIASIFIVVVMTALLVNYLIVSENQESSKSTPGVTGLHTINIPSKYFEDPKTRSSAMYCDMICEQHGGVKNFYCPGNHCQCDCNDGTRTTA